MICVTKKTIQLTVAASALFASAGITLAADLPPPPPPYEVRSSIHDWGGVYIGVIAGYGVSKVSYIPNGGADPHLDDKNLIGGGMIGYNYQFDNIVVGVEADAVGTALFARDTQGANNDTVLMDTDFISTLRARAGWAFDNTLLYVTGGIGFMRNTATIQNNPAAPIIPLRAGLVDSQTHIGLVVGGGVEHAITDNITARAEYMYGTFKSKRYSYATGDFVDITPDDLHMMRAGVAYKF